MFTAVPLSLIARRSLRTALLLVFATSFDPQELLLQSQISGGSEEGEEQHRGERASGETRHYLDTSASIFYEDCIIRVSDYGGEWNRQQEDERRSD